MTSESALEAPPPSRRARLAIAAAVALGAAALSILWSMRYPAFVNDFDHLWYAARAALHGGDPYAVVGPGRAFDYPFVEHYPGPAILLVAPLAYLPLRFTRAAFVGLSAGALAYGATRDGYGRLPLFASGAFVMALTAAQWSPLVTAIAFLPALAWLAVAKPNLGAAVTLSRLEPKPLILAAAGALVLGVLSLIAIPGWPARWLSNVRETTHFVAPIRHWAGPVLLLALLRWRRRESRLLLAMACVPHTTMVYETLELFVVPRRRVETMTLALLSWVAWVAQAFVNPNVPLGPGGSLMADPRYAEYVHAVGDITLALLYLPCLIMVLRRPNEGDVPRWLERVVERATARTRAALGAWRPSSSSAG
ncbi:MAG TPA: hypothetical protein VFJ74_04585 [Gemmatimonadaceae bacterium]|nr:hypothetical protein [Gemmatimonadaceae bacterium]